MMYVTINEVVKKALLQQFAKDDGLGIITDFWDDYTEAETDLGNRIRLLVDIETIKLYFLFRESWYLCDEYEKSDLIDYLCELVLNLHNKNSDLAQIVGTLSEDL